MAEITRDLENVAGGAGAQRYIQYTIRSGDTLSAIALTFNTTIQAIQAANPSITNPNLIYAGQVILIPVG